MDLINKHFVTIDDHWYKCNHCNQRIWHDNRDAHIIQCKNKFKTNIGYDSFSKTPDGHFICHYCMNKVSPFGRDAHLSECRNMFGKNHETIADCPLFNKSPYCTIGITGSCNNYPCKIMVNTRSTHDSQLHSGDYYFVNGRRGRYKFIGGGMIHFFMDDTNEYEAFRIHSDIRRV